MYSGFPTQDKNTSDSSVEASVETLSLEMAGGENDISLGNNVMVQEMACLKTEILVLVLFFAH